MPWNLEPFKIQRCLKALTLRNTMPIWIGATTAAKKLPCISQRHTKLLTTSQTWDMDSATRNLCGIKFRQLRLLLTSSLQVFVATTCDKFQKSSCHNVLQLWRGTFHPQVSVLPRHITSSIAGITFHHTPLEESSIHSTWRVDGGKPAQVSGKPFGLKKRWENVQKVNYPRLQCFFFGKFV